VQKLETDNMFSKLEMAGLADPYLCSKYGLSGSYDRNFDIYKLVPS
jgi:hypothetical protein